MKCWLPGALLFLSLNAVTCRKSREVRIVSANTKYYNELSLHTIIQDAIDQSVELVLKNCQQQFRWDRWNCPTIDFHSKRSSMQLDRETAFVQTLTMAALIYTVTKNCSQGEIKGCECNSVPSEWKFDIDEPEIAYDCSDQIDQIGERIASNLFSPPISDTRFDAQGYANLHNNRAARIAIRNAMRKHCRCYGLFGACGMQTCWMSQNMFATIAGDLRRMYDHAELVTYNNKGHIDTNIRNDSLVYVFASPDYCEKNAIAGWKGTAGRQCSRNKENGVSQTERKSCRNLCRLCGHRVRRQTIVQKKWCNCKFSWCCNVTCDTCIDYVDEFYCH